MVRDSKRRLRLTLSRWPVVAGALLLAPHVPARAATTLLPGWSAPVVASGLSAPVGFVFLPDGRLLVAERAGGIRLVTNGVVAPEPLRTIPVTTGAERGLLGIALDPDFPTNGFIYVYYTTADTVPANRVSRLVLQGDTLLPGETTILGDIPSDNGVHNGGDLHFGPDRKLYVGVGDGGVDSSKAQDLANVNGKILRLNADGSVPPDNPYADQPGARGEIWVHGLRNPFRFSFDTDGRMFIGDVGSQYLDEINVLEPGERGLNFGWPLQEGPCAPPSACTVPSNPPGVVPPVHYTVNPPVGLMSITGGVTAGPGAYEGFFDQAYFFADFGAAVLDVLRYDPATKTVTVRRLGTDVRGVVQLVRGPDGRVFYTSLMTGEIRRLDFDPSLTLRVTGAAHPSAAEPGQQVTVTATVIPAPVPVSTGIGVTADLGPLGGSAAQVLYDDGTNGDTTAGDRVFSYLTTVSHAAPLGVATLSVQAIDAQGRIADGSAQVIVQAILDADGDSLPDRCETAFGLDPASSALYHAAAGDFDEDGATNLEECQNATHPRGYFVRRFAEGATSAFLRTEFGVTNPHSSATASVLFRFQRSAGGVLTHVLSVPPDSHATLDVASVPGMATAEFATEVESDLEVTVERTMSWDRSAYGSHSQSGLPSASTRWYLAEGATHSNFDLFYLLQNPNDTTASVTVTYLRPAGLPALVRGYTVAPQARLTLWVNFEDPGLAAVDVSATFEADIPIVVERAMYLGGTTPTWRAGHAGAGATATDTEWYFAEGATGPFFDLYLLLANPGAQDAQVEVTYLLPEGAPLIKSYVVPALSRYTIRVDAEATALADTAVSAVVRSTNGVGLVAERAMWWPGEPPTWTEAHNSLGATRTSHRWTVAGGDVGGTRGAETYLLIANTSDRPGQARVALLDEHGASHVTTVDLPPSSRTNVAVAADVPELQDARFGALIESLGDAPVDLVVERATYWQAGAEFWAAGANTLATEALVADVTVEIRPDGLSPDHIEIPVGGRVRFVNLSADDTFIASDPHPGHSICRAMDPVKRLKPGETAISGPFRVAQDCTLHEHLNYDPRYHATVVVR